MAVFKKQGVYWIDYYVSGRRKRERIGPDKRLAETVLKKRKVDIAEGRFLDKQRSITTTFEELADAYLAWIAPDEQRGIPARKRSWYSGDLYAIGKLRPYFGGQRLIDMTPALVSQYQAHRQASLSLRAARETFDDQSRVGYPTGHVQRRPAWRVGAQRWCPRAQPGRLSAGLCEGAQRA